MSFIIALRLYSTRYLSPFSHGLFWYHIRGESNSPGFLSFLCTAVHVIMSCTASEFLLIRSLSLPLSLSLSLFVYWHSQGMMGCQEIDFFRQRMRPEKRKLPFTEIVKFRTIRFDFGVSPCLSACTDRWNHSFVNDFLIFKSAKFGKQQFSWRNFSETSLKIVLRKSENIIQYWSI